MSTVQLKEEKQTKNAAQSPESGWNGPPTDCLRSGLNITQQMTD